RERRFRAAAASPADATDTASTAATAVRKRSRAHPARNAETDRYRWEKCRARFLDQGARLAVARLRPGDVLVGDVDLLFERVQLGLVEHLPPRAAKPGVLRLGDSPAVDFLVSRRHFHFRPDVVRPDRARREPTERRQEGGSLQLS